MRKHSKTSTIKTKNISISKSDRQRSNTKGDKQRSNTCYAYFMVKKPDSCGPKLRHNNNNKQHIGSVSSFEEKLCKDKEIVIERPKRCRYDSQKLNDGKSKASPLLCIEDVLMIVAAQESYDGGVNCYVCGKLYKSRVCFIKHIWEHTVYWNMFEGAKNHERVLSIQAAIILSGGINRQLSKSADTDLCSLLVTSPHSSETKHEKDSCMAQSNGLQINNCHSSLVEECPQIKGGVHAENSKHISHDNSETYQHILDIVECNYQPLAHIPFLRSPISSPLQTCPAASILQPLPLQTCPTASILQPLPLQTCPASILQPSPLQTCPAASILQPSALQTCPAASILQPSPLQTCPASILQPSPLQTCPAASILQPSPLQTCPAASILQPSPLQTCPAASILQPSALQTCPAASILQPSPLQTCPASILQPSPLQTCPAASILQSSPLQSYPAASSERLPSRLIAALPSQQFSSPNVCKDYQHSHASANSYMPLESDGVNFVSPLKRKRED